MYSLGKCMLNINNSFFKSQFKPNVKKRETQLNVFYTNDMHGDLNNLGKLKTAHDEFKKENEGKPNLFLAAGDCLFGTDSARSKLLVKVFNMMKLDALALGNHEFAAGADALSEKLEKAEFKSVSANLEIPEGNKLQDRIKDKKLVKTAVFMKGGEKFAVIGASPINSYIGVKENPETKTKPMDLDKTIKAINNEAKSLERQGINKIILCSHLGYGEEGDLKVARETEGIDIIIGGHSHTAINGINEKDAGGDKRLNLVKSKRKEPVLITQVSGMNKTVGNLNAVFDKDGILNMEKTTNNVTSLDKFSEDKKIETLMEKSLGKNEVLAKVKTPFLPKSVRAERSEENELQNLHADAVVEAGKTQGVQASLFGTAALCGGAKDSIKSYDVKYSMLPFNDNVNAVNMKESDVIRLLNAATKDCILGKNDPQILRCGGMKYDILRKPLKNDKGEDIYVNNVKFTDNEGQDIFEIDSLNPSEDKKVVIAIPDYLFQKDTTKDILAPYNDEKTCFGTDQEILINYLKSQEEVDFSKKPNRINII